MADPEEVREVDAVGRRLEQARRRARLSMTTLARLARVPISTLSNIRHGRRRGDTMSVAMARRLCEALHITMDWLSGLRQDDPDNPAPPGQDDGEQPGPGREHALMRLVAEAELMKRLRITEPADTRRIADDDPGRNPDDDPA